MELHRDWLLRALHAQASSLGCDLVLFGQPLDALTGAKLNNTWLVQKLGLTDFFDAQIPGKQSIEGHLTELLS